MEKNEAAEFATTATSAQNPKADNLAEVTWHWNQGAEVLGGNGKVPTVFG